MKRFLLTAVVAFLLAGVVTCRTVDDTAKDLIEALSQSSLEDWSSAFLSTNNPLRGPVLPSTLFIPSAASDLYDGKSKRRAAAYHILPEKLDYFKLCSKINGTRLQTHLGGRFITLSNSSSGLTLNGVNLTEPDVYVDAVGAIHRVASPLNVGMFAGQISASHGFLNGLILFFTFFCILVLMILGKKHLGF